MLLLIYARPCHGALQTGVSLEDHTLAMHVDTPVLPSCLFATFLANTTSISGRVFVRGI